MNEFIRAVEGFLALFSEAGEEARMGRIERLATALDALASAYHTTPRGPFVHVPGQPPRADDGYKQSRAAAVAAFPDFGFYSCVRPDAVPPDPEDFTIADAIDDLADIAGDLSAVAWRWHNNGAADAAWHFRNLYEIHWGRHLHDLRNYVHFQQFGQ